MNRGISPPLPTRDAPAAGHSVFSIHRRPHLPAQTQAVSRLGQWPCQIRLAPVNAPYFDGAKLLIAADCSAYAYARMHEDFIRGKITLIGCPKLDSVDYSEKLNADHSKQITSKA